MLMTSKTLSSILGPQWRHCSAAAGFSITVIRWRGPGFTGLVASVVRDPPCSEHTYMCYSDQREITDRQFRYRIQWQFLRNKAKGEDHTALIHGRVKKGLGGEFKLFKTVGMSVVRWWANCTIPTQSAQRLHFNISHFSSPTTTTAAQQQSAQHLASCGAAA